MILQTHIPELLDAIRQKSKHKTENFVLDFLDIWFEIHHRTEGTNIEGAFTVCQSLLESHILPFYKKYKNTGNLNSYKGWIDSFASIHLKWGERGGFLFPLILVTYEITYRKKSLLFDLLTQLKTGVLQGKKEDLFEIIFPILANFTLPLDDIDIGILKAYQTLQPLKSILFKNPENKSFAEMLDVSTRTIIRRLKVINLLQLVHTNYFVDMGKLGYETLLYVHRNPFPEKFKNFLLLSGNLDLGTFSIVQIPSNQLLIQSSLQEKLDLLISHPLLERITSWNLGGLSKGEENWKNPPTFFYANPEVKIRNPSPDMEMSLKPTFDSFRQLTRADFNILDFLVREGSFRNLDQLSKAINVNRFEISTRLKEYTNEDLIFKTQQFFNIGLDLSLFFFISDVDKKIPWISHLLTFPKVDIFYQTEEEPHYYFGFLKLPNKWIKSFARKIDLIRNEYDVKFYYKIYSSIDHFQWGLSLTETYHYRK